MFYVTHVWIIYLSDFSIHHNYLRSKHWGFTQIKQQKVSCEHLAKVWNTSSSDTHCQLYTKKEYLLLHNKVINVVPTFASISYHIGASAQSLEELIQTFRCHFRGWKKRSNSAIRRQNAELLCFFFSLKVRFWGKTKFVSKEIFSS